jgi:hypothetical protein
MSDTRQHVGWHLRYACPFRQGEAVDVFAKALHATSELRLIDDMTARGEVYGGVVVTSVSYSREGRWPSDGFRISDAVAVVGSLAAARATCGSCPANAFGSPKMAGCCGSLPIHADDPAVDAAIRGEIDGGLADEFSAAFLRTNPLWYGLWVSDPLSTAQLRLLPRILQRVAVGSAELKQFLRACGLALEYGLELHVRMSPPGHVDFGFYSVFPHCPRCKRGTGEQWTKASTQMITCQTCGMQFIPAENTSSEREVFERTELKARLSPEEYAAVHNVWLERHGSDPHPLAAFLSFDPSQGDKPPPHSPPGFADLLKRMRRWFKE